MAPDCALRLEPAFLFGGAQRADGPPGEPERGPAVVGEWASGWSKVNGLTSATAVSRRTSGGRTVNIRFAR